jgi:hypothetical protein
VHTVFCLPSSTPESVSTSDENFRKFPEIFGKFPESFPKHRYYHKNKDNMIKISRNIDATVENKQLKIDARTSYRESFHL